MVSSRGIGLRRLIGTKWIRWDELRGIFWRHAKVAAGAKTIFLQTSNETIPIEDNGYALGDLPMIDVIFGAWNEFGSTSEPVTFVRPRLVGKWCLTGVAVTFSMFALVGALLFLGCSQIQFFDAASFSIVAMFLVFVAAILTHREQAGRWKTGVVPVDVDGTPDLSRARGQMTAIHPGMRFAAAVLRKLFPPRRQVDGALITERQFENRFRQLDRRYNQRIGVMLLALGVVFLAGFALGDARYYPRSSTEIFENRRTQFKGMALASFAVSAGLAIHVVYSRARRREASDFSFYDCYSLALWGFDGLRAARWFVVGLLTAGIIIGIASWGSRELIDAEGVHFKNGCLSSEFHRFEEIADIELEPVRRRDRCRLVIRFKAGSVFRSQFSWTSDRWGPIVKFLQERTGLPTREGASE